MENEEKERLLPIGTIVLLKNANTELMITSYCITAMPQNFENSKNLKLTRNMMFDYGGCRYPEGVSSSNAMIVFNESQIDKIVYMGYKTEDSDNHMRKIKGRMNDFIEKNFNNTNSEEVA